MPKLPNKTLLGCLTLLTTYSSANLGYVNATETSVEPEPTPNNNAPDLAEPELGETEPVETTDTTNTIVPDSHTQPVFAARSTTVTVAPQSASAAAKLDRLVATATQEIDGESSLLTRVRNQAVAVDATPKEQIVDETAEAEVSEDVVLGATNPTQIAVDQAQPEAITNIAIEDRNETILLLGDTVEPSDAAAISPHLEKPLAIAQVPLEPPIVNQGSQDQEIIDELFEEDVSEGATPYRSAPAITISNPSGFGADNFTGFVGVGYQERTRFGNEDDGGLVVGIGLGDARENVGVQLSYTVASFGGSRDFGTGGFNAKLHKRLADEWSVALGWEGFATTGFVDFEDSIYGSVSHLIRTRERITQPFSRVALTAGVGSGRFRTEDDVFDDRDSVGVFGSMAVRVAEPVSAIVEWTGQDLAAGLSITPFRDIPIVLLPAVRDLAGAGDGARFVMGAGFSFQF